jgi:hypothetical protein
MAILKKPENAINIKFLVCTAIIWISAIALLIECMIMVGAIEPAFIAIIPKISPITNTGSPCVRFPCRRAQISAEPTIANTSP